MHIFWDICTKTQFLTFGCLKCWLLSASPINCPILRIVRKSWFYCSYFITKFFKIVITIFKLIWNSSKNYLLIFLYCIEINTFKYSSLLQNVFFRNLAVHKENNCFTSKLNKCGTESSAYELLISFLFAYFKLADSCKYSAPTISEHCLFLISLATKLAYKSCLASNCDLAFYNKQLHSSHFVQQKYC